MTPIIMVDCWMWCVRVVAVSWPYTVSARRELVESLCGVICSKLPPPLPHQRRTLVMTIQC